MNIMSPWIEKGLILFKFSKYFPLGSVQSLGLYNYQKIVSIGKESNGKITSAENQTKLVSPSSYCLEWEIFLIE